MNSNSLLFLIVSVLLALFGVKGANGIQCYECSGTYGNTIMNVCRAGHIGERKNCSSEVKNCYKSRTTEAVPKLARRCGTTKKVQSICQEVNIGSNSKSFVIAMM
ncbi:uncharacterized protein [Lepeophtheirus salmonis]|uniref:uncharacterized protein n=1 Tax=Lepeophtheirus salmonis TaxID=72036 RepID=UPI001AE54643|nr:uncharacterized protein LOC121115430 [Lepeophtheirus salmonis]XP_040565563.1 uncharacterized protein LOC121115430 [Lepeophtheirus salmonis]